MSQITVVVQSLEEAKAGKGIVPGIKKVREIKDLSFGILEKGTVGGQTTLMVVLKDGDQAYIGQCTGNQFEGLVSAFKGADFRFKNKGC